MRPHTKQSRFLASVVISDSLIHCQYYTVNKTSRTTSIKRPPYLSAIRMNDISYPLLSSGSAKRNARTNDFWTILKTIIRLDDSASFCVSARVCPASSVAMQRKLSSHFIKKVLDYKITSKHLNKSWLVNTQKAVLRSLQRKFYVLHSSWQTADCSKFAISRSTPC